MLEALTAIFGVIVGSIVTWRSAIRAADRQAFSAAGASLRSVFAPIQSRLRNEKISEWNEFRTEMQNLFDTHAIELEKFRFYVSESQIAEYDAACRNYRKVVHSRSISSATTERGNVPDDRSDKDRFLDALDPILAFTKPKSTHCVHKYLAEFINSNCTHR